MITKYIKSFFHIMLLLINALSCSKFDYDKREIEITDKAISIENGHFCLIQMHGQDKDSYIIDDSYIDYSALAKYYEKIINNNNEFEYKRRLLECFINDFYGSRFKVTGVDCRKASDGSGGVDVTISPQLFIKNEAGVVLAPFGKYGINMNSENITMIRGDGDELHLKTNIMMIRIITTMERDDTQVLKYIVCALPHVQQLIISNLCKFFVSEITEFLSYQDRSQEQVSHGHMTLSQAQTMQFHDEAEKTINLLNPILEDIESMQLSAQEFIEKNQRLSAGDSKRLAEEEIRALLEGGAQNNIHDVLINISTTNIRIYQAINNKLFVFNPDCEEFIENFELDSIEAPDFYIDLLNLDLHLDRESLRPIERLFIQAFAIYVDCFEGGLIRQDTGR